MLLQQIGAKSKSFYIRQTIPNTLLSIIPRSQYVDFLTNFCNSLNSFQSSNALHFTLQQMQSFVSKISINTGKAQFLSS
jgi:hypothetical protein